MANMGSLCIDGEYVWVDLDDYSILPGDRAVLLTSAGQYRIFVDADHRAITPISRFLGEAFDNSVIVGRVIESNRAY